MSDEDHKIIANIANKHRPGMGTFVELKKTNHLLYTYDTPEEAFKGAPSGYYNPAATSAVLDFLRNQQ